MRDFQIFVWGIGKGSNPLGARTQSPNLPWGNWVKCNVFIIKCLRLYSSALLTKIGSVPTIFADEPCRILVFNQIHLAIKYVFFREPPLSIFIKEEFDVTSGSSERTGKAGYFCFFWEFLHSAVLACPFT